MFCFANQFRSVHFIVQNIHVQPHLFARLRGG